MTTKRFLVIGGSGFLGGHVVSWATQNGFEVAATYFSGHPSESASEATASHDASTVHWYQCDIVDAEAVDQLVDSFQPTVVVNAAYRQHGQGAFEICSTGAANVAGSAARGGARLVHLSTDLVFDGKLGRWYTETDEINPINDYGRAKAEAEQRVTAACPNSVLVRTSLIYGDPQGHQEKLVARAAKGEQIAFFFDEWRNPAPVVELADVVGRLGLDEQTGPLHVTGNERIDRLSFAQMLAESLGLDPEVLIGSPSDFSRGPRASDVSLDTSLATSLGYGLPGPSTVLRPDPMGAK